MCRITGFWDFNFNNQYNLEKISISMRDTLIHGGPDDYGLYINPENGLAFGHRRLSIIDLSMKAHQPMKFDNLVIAYNGEVYNYREIRNELLQDGYNFSSDSDTEVVLKAFHKWKFDCVHKFRGMWSFGIWDERNKILTLCRDRLGVKPLYWYYKDGLFMFTSELKAFHKHPIFSKEIDYQSLSLFLQYGYISAPHCIFKNSHKLPSGHFLTINNRKDIKINQYWEPEDYLNKNQNKQTSLSLKNENDVINELEQILTESFQLRMVADVPVGMFLSGGIDSSLVTAILQKNSMSKIKTFTIGFYEEKYNEAEWAKKIASYLGTDHTELYCTPSDAYSIIKQLPDIYDEPFGDSSAIPTLLVAKLAKQHIKVSLSADGGDEQFFGYSRYWRYKNLINKLDNKIIASLIGKVSPEIAFFIYKKLNFLLPNLPAFKNQIHQIQELLKYNSFLQKYDTLVKTFINYDFINLNFTNPITQIDYKAADCNQDSQMMYYDIKYYLQDDILTKIDRATMAVSLEGREPLLDNKIVEYSLSLPNRLKYNNGSSKYILRKILNKYIPTELIERPKKGFSVPIYEWFNIELSQLYSEYLNKNRISKEGFFNAKFIGELLTGYQENNGINHNKLWLLFIYQIWKERWLNNN